MQINWNDASIGYFVQIEFGGVVLETKNTNGLSSTFTGLISNRKYIIIVTPFNSVGTGPTNSNYGFTQQGNVSRIHTVYGNL